MLSFLLYIFIILIESRKRKGSGVEVTQVNQYGGVREQVLS